MKRYGPRANKSLELRLQPLSVLGPYLFKIMDPISTLALEHWEVSYSLLILDYLLWKIQHIVEFKFIWRQYISLVLAKWAYEIWYLILLLCSSSVVMVPGLAKKRVFLVFFGFFWFFLICNLFWYIFLVKIGFFPQN